MASDWPRTFLQPGYFCLAYRLQLNFTNLIKIDISLNQSNAINHVIKLYFYEDISFSYIPSLIVFLYVYTRAQTKLARFKCSFE